MGNTLTKNCCGKSAPDEKILEGVEYTPSNGTPNGYKKPSGDKGAGKIKNDAADISSAHTELDSLDVSIEDEPSEQLSPNYYYKMNHKKRGMALIFNHELFECNKPRTGSSVDRNRLQHTLESLDFDVKIFENETVSDIKGILQEIAEMDHSDSDCLMIVVLSHGDVVPLVDRRGKMYTTILTHDLVSYVHASDNKYPLQMIWENFTDEKCPSLANKPRIFLITACQGAETDEGYGVPIEHYRRRRPGGDIIPFSTTKYKPFDAVRIDRTKNMPQKDFLVIFSTMLGYYSYRDTEDGTWFISSLCEVLNEKKHELDFFQILTLVNQKVALDYQSGPDASKQIPCILSMLTKLLFFPKRKSLCVPV